MSIGKNKNISLNFSGMRNLVFPIMDAFVEAIPFNIVYFAFVHFKKRKFDNWYINERMEERSRERVKKFYRYI